MKIVDIDIRELDSVTRRGRARSPEMTQLISTIGSLKSTEAKAAVISGSDTAKVLRSRLLYAARIAGKRLQIAEKDGKVLFTVAGRARRRRRKVAQNGA
jgi:hypothetical protein